MFVASFTADLLVPGSTSLKDKRGVVRSLVAELSRRGVSVAEVGHHDLRARAEIGVAIVSGTARHAGDVLDACERVVRSRPEIDVVAIQRRLWKDSDDDDPPGSSLDAGLDEQETHDG